MNRSNALRTAPARCLAEGLAADALMATAAEGLPIASEIAGTSNRWPSPGRPVAGLSRLPKPNEIANCEKGRQRRRAILGLFKIPQLPGHAGPSNWLALEKYFAVVTKKISVRLGQFFGQPNRLSLKRNEVLFQRGLGEEFAQSAAQNHLKPPVERD